MGWEYAHFRACAVLLEQAENSRNEHTKRPGITQKSIVTYLSKLTKENPRSLRAGVFDLSAQGPIPYGQLIYLPLETRGISGFR